MKLAQCHPLLFLVTGLVWLMLASVIGVALFLAMMLGHPLPAVLRHFHVHGALVGGVVQVIVGMMLASGERSKSHPVLFAAINVGTIGMLAGFWSGYNMAVAVAGSISDFSAWPAWRSLWDWESERPWPCGSFPMKISDKPDWLTFTRRCWDS